MVGVFVGVAFAVPVAVRAISGVLVAYGGGGENSVARYGCVTQKDG